MGAFITNEKPTGKMEMEEETLLYKGGVTSVPSLAFMAAQMTTAQFPGHWEQFWAQDDKWVSCPVLQLMPFPLLGTVVKLRQKNCFELMQTGWKQNMEGML